MPAPAAILVGRDVPGERLRTQLASSQPVIE
jgi:hypothetical protein